MVNLCQFSRASFSLQHRGFGPHPILAVLRSSPSRAPTKAPARPAPPAGHTRGHHALPRPAPGMFLSVLWCADTALTNSGRAAHGRHCGRFRPATADRLAGHIPMAWGHAWHCVAVSAFPRELEHCAHAGPRPTPRLDWLSHSRGRPAPPRPRSLSKKQIPFQPFTLPRVFILARRPCVPGGRAGFLCLPPAPLLLNTPSGPLLTSGLNNNVHVPCVWHDHGKTGPVRMEQTWGESLGKTPSTHSSPPLCSRGRSRSHHPPYTLRRDL